MDVENQSQSTKLIVDAVKNSVVILGIDTGPYGFVIGSLVGIAGALAMWFNEILNGEAKFNIPNFLMLCFVGATIGGLAVTVAPMFHVPDNYTIIFACAAAAAHKYIFRSISWFLDKWTKV